MPVHVYKVKSPSGIIGPNSRNECADAIAKHAALRNDGYDEILLPPNTDGSPNSHMARYLKTENEALNSKQLCSRAMAWPN